MLIRELPLHLPFGSIYDTVFVLIDCACLQEAVQLVPLDVMVHGAPAPAPVWLSSPTQTPFAVRSLDDDVGADVMPAEAEALTCDPAITTLG